MGCTGREFGPLLPPAARSFVLGRIWGLFWSHRPPKGLEQMFENPPRADNSGKKSTRRGHENFAKFFSKTLDFLEIPAGSTIVGRPIIAHFVAFVNRQNAQKK
jgi:hypothetical protein